MWVYTCVCGCTCVWVCLCANILPKALVGSESSEHQMFFFGLLPTRSHLSKYSLRPASFTTPCHRTLGSPVQQSDRWMLLFEGAQRHLVPHLPSTTDTAATLLSPTLRGSSLVTTPQIPSQSFLSSLQHLWSSFPLSTTQSLWKLSPISSQNSCSQRVERASEILGGTKKWTLVMEIAPYFLWKNVK